MNKVTLLEKKELREALDRINEKSWPQFMLNWDCKEWSHLYTTFAQYQILITSDDDEIMAFGHTIPIFWNESVELISDNLDILIKDAVKANKNGKKPNVLLALAAVVSENHKGKGLSYEVVKEMKDMAIKHEITDVLIPVRPTLKTKYPLIPLEQYIKSSKRG